MKRYIALNSPVRVRASGERVTAQEAAVRFLRQTLIEIEAALAPGTVSELIFTAPTDSFDFYRDWLKLSFEAPNLAVRVLDEAGAAAADAGIRLESGEPFFVLDVGGTTQQVLVAAHDSNGTIRVRGKDGRSTGGADIDHWILETEKPFLMPVEDVFTITGRGTVVTGRVERDIIIEDRKSVV